MLLARGIEEADLARHRAPTIRDFLPDPSEFKDMDKAAKRLADAVEAGETVAIFGDYDVDGATSAALLTILLRRLGVEPMIYIPDRLMEGYGPSGAALVELKRRGASLAITVDCVGAPAHVHAGLIELELDPPRQQPVGGHLDWDTEYTARSGRTAKL